MSNDILTEHYLFVGQSGCGKTRTAMDLAEIYYNNVGARIIAFTREKTDIIREGNYDFQDSMKLINIQSAQYRQGFNFSKALANEENLLFRMELDAEQIGEMLDKVPIDRPIFRSKRPVFVIVDEAATTFDKTKGADGLKRILTEGRSHGVASAWIVQNITGVRKQAVKLSNHLVIFRVPDHNALQKIWERYSKAGIKKRVQSLENFECIHINHDTFEDEQFKTYNPS